MSRGWESSSHAHFAHAGEYLSAFSAYYNISFGSCFSADEKNAMPRCVCPPKAFVYRCRDQYICSQRRIIASLYRCCCLLPLFREIAFEVLCLGLSEESVCETFIEIKMPADAACNLCVKGNNMQMELLRIFILSMRAKNTFLF